MHLSITAVRARGSSMPVREASIRRRGDGQNNFNEGVAAELSLWALLGKPKSVGPHALEADLVARFGNDPKLLWASVRVFLKDCPLRLREINTAIKRRDAERLSPVAHTPKGSIGNFTTKDASPWEEMPSCVRSQDLSHAQKTARAPYR